MQWRCSAMISNPCTSRLTLFLVGLAAICGCAEAAIHKYNGAKFIQISDAFLFTGGREGLFASSKDAVDHWMHVAKGVANGKSYIRFEDIKFRRPDEEAAAAPKEGPSGLIEALVFEVGDRNRIGYLSSSGMRAFCCTPELKDRISCEAGRIIIRPRDGSNQWPRVIPVYFHGNESVAQPAVSEVRVTSPGMYFLWFIICDKTLSGVSVTGSTVWKNPGGYLPGMMTPYLTFYGALWLAYLVLGVFWLLQYLRFWKDVLQLQHCISAVILLFMVEAATWFFDFLNFNSSGQRPMGITILAVTIGAVRKAVSRVLVLIVAMGFGVVRPTLGGLSQKVILLGGAYFVAVELFDVMVNVGAVDDLNAGEKLFLVLPVAVLDAVFILWIFSSLSKTLTQLQAKRSSFKLDLYRRFTNSLALAVLVSVAWIAYEMYFRLSDPFNERWQAEWVLSCFWHVLTYLLLALICVLWSPSQNGNRYAYSEDDKEEDDEQVALTAAGASAAPSAAPAAAEKKPVNTDVFSLDDEEEGGKLE